MTGAKRPFHCLYTSTHQESAARPEVVDLHLPSDPASCHRKAKTGSSLCAHHRPTSLLRATTYIGPTPKHTHLGEPYIQTHLVSLRDSVTLSFVSLHVLEVSNNISFFSLLFFPGEPSAPTLDADSEENVFAPSKEMLGILCLFLPSAEHPSSVVYLIFACGTS